MKKLMLIILSATLFVAGCKEKMDVKLDTSASKIVIEGSITNELKKQSIKITKSTDYFYNEHTPAVSGANVQVSDGTNSYNFTESQPGLYVSETAFAGTPGLTYELTVAVNNELYTSSSKMNPIMTIDSIALEKATVPIQPGVILDPDKSYYNILLYGQEPGETEDSYMMDAYKNGILYTDTITKKNITDDIIYNGSYIDGVKCLQLEAVPGDTITFQLSSITRQYCLYIFAIREVLMNGNPFAGPPSNIIGNISNGALGYFYASATTYKTRVIN